MADKKLTELTVIDIVKLTDLLYLVTYDSDGDSVSYSVTAETLFNSIVTGENRIISGQVVYTGTGFTFESVNLAYEVNNMIYYSHGDQVTCAAPDATHPRLDVIFADAAGLDIKEGTPAATPAEPSLDNPTLEIKTNLVLVQVGASAPTEISLDAMYLENAQEVGGEWDTSESTSGNRITLGSTINPIDGLKSIRAEIPQSNDYFELNHSTAITIADFNNLRHTFRSFGKWKNDYVKVEFMDGATVVGASTITGNSFPTSDTVLTHEVYITSGVVVWVSGYTEFDTVRYTWKNANNTTGAVSNAGFQVDLIYVQHGGDPTVPEPTTVLASKVYVNVDNFSGNLSSSDTNVQLALETIDALSTSASPLTTKGDVWGYDSADNRIPIGTDGQVLTADSAQTLGLKWSTPAGGGDVTKVGTPVNNQIGVWTGDGTIEGTSDFTFIGSTDSSLGLGTNDTKRGQIVLQGGSGAYGGYINIYNGATGDTDDDRYEIATISGKLVFSGTSTGTFMEYNSADNELYLYDKVETLIVAFSDETTVVDAGTGKVSFNMPNYATTLTDVSVSFVTAPTTSAITIDLNEGGTSVLSTKITVDATETSSETAATPPVISDSSLAANAIMTVDVDTADSGGTSAGGKIILYYKRA